MRPAPSSLIIAIVFDMPAVYCAIFVAGALDRGLNLIFVFAEKYPRFP